MPAFFNRGMPGVIAVTRNGKRFSNEGRSYHDFCVNLMNVTQGEDEPVAWIVFDHRVLRRYGMGPIYPWPMPYKHHIKSGFLKRGSTVRDLANDAGIDPDELEKTIDRYNAYAREGEDPDFHRGSNAFDLASGDPEHRPNPCVGPLDAAPYYAIRVFAGCVGTFSGLKTNGKGQVLNQSREPIPGLYSGGNDMLSITGGDYISGGCTVGPGLTFGYIIGKDVSAQS
jgi:succinate dehydrogenase/fumarate reductase flavoprotein subunit